MELRPSYVPLWAFRLFLRIAEPRVVRLLQFAVYIVLLLGGVSAWWAPPEAIAQSLGAVLTGVWGGLLILGGLLGSSSDLRGSWWVERAGLSFCAAGIAIYGINAVFLEVSHAGPSRLMQVATIAAVLLQLAIRWVRIRRYAYDPEG
jgi:hypothetical protein